MKPYPVDRLTAALLILAGAAAPGAVVTYHLGSLGLLGALAFVLSLIYAVDKRLPDAGASMPDDAVETPHAAIGATERLDQRFPDVYPEIVARDVASGRLVRIIAIEAATWATER